MRRVRLIHWNAAEAKERAERLESLGYVVDCAVPRGAAFLRELREQPPAAVVIDLERLPAQGRDMGLAVRHQKATRHLPLVFLGGEAEKVARARKLLPDATYATWGRVKSALRRAIAHPPTAPVVPRSALEGYSGRPLTKKLGIKPGSVVCLVGAPRGFENTLGELPAGAKLRRRAQGRADVTLWFVKRLEDLQRGIRRMGESYGQGSLWIAWPKQASGMSSDLTQQHVREIGLATGLVDYKICAIDATWSGLLFTRRKPKRG